MHRIRLTGSGVVRATADYAPACRSFANIVAPCGPTRYGTAKGQSQRPLYRQSAQEFEPHGLIHVIAEDDDIRNCIWTAAASCGTGVDHSDRVCVPIFGHRNSFARPTN